MSEEFPGGLASRLNGVASGLLRHGLSLTELAAIEARLLVRQSIGTILLIAIMLVFGVISYVALIGALVALLAVKLSWGWPVSLASAGLIHLAMLGAAYTFLKGRRPIRPFEATSSEIRRDIETLSSLANGNRVAPPR
jgi:hypothetical protein